MQSEFPMQRHRMREWQLIKGTTFTAAYQHPNFYTVILHLRRLPSTDWIDTLWLSCHSLAQYFRFIALIVAVCFYAKIFYWSDKTLKVTEGTESPNGKVSLSWQRNNIFSTLQFFNGTGTQARGDEIGAPTARAMATDFTCSYSFKYVLPKPYTSFTY